MGFLNMWITWNSKTKNRNKGTLANKLRSYRLLGLHENQIKFDLHELTLVWLVNSSHVPLGFLIALVRSGCLLTEMKRNEFYHVNAFHLKRSNTIL